MSGHTPGPWSFDYTCFDSRIPIRGGCTVYGRPFNVALVNRPGSARSGEDKANAALIAAAPELLEALKALREAIMDGLCNSGTPAYVGGPERLDAAINAAAEAIAKAEASTPSDAGIVGGAGR